MIRVAAAVLVATTCVGALTTSPCGPQRCRRSLSPLCVFGNEPSCECAPSVRGTFCAECGFQGHLQDGECACARDTDSDPNAFCAKLVSTTETVAVARKRTTIACACSHSWELGLFVSSSAATRTGMPNPPACDACVSFGVGPQPSGVQLDVEFGVRPQACTRYGGLDPATPLESTWRECSGHGVWNETTRACACDEGWTLRLTDSVGFNGETVATCASCAPLRGPPRSCAAVFTPDPLTGRESECGGHGVFSASSRSCHCFANATAGYWTLLNVSADATVWDAPSRALTTRTFVVASCVACAAPHQLATACR